MQRHLAVALLIAAAASLGGAADPTTISACNATELMDVDGQLFLAPEPGQEAAWRAKLDAWKRRCSAALNDSAPIFAEPDLLWTQTSYVQPQMHPYDRYFYEPGQGYTVDKWVKDVEDRYGGVDSLLFWPTYTNIGVDDRNQYDLVRALPGGPRAIRAQVAALHARGIKVLLPYNPWDNFTRPVDPEHPGPAGDPVQMALLINDTGADGFNGDTMVTIPVDFLAAARALKGPRHGRAIALEPENGAAPEDAYFDTMSWGYWSKRQAPGVDRMKYLNAKHMTHVCSRWMVNKSDDLQAAFFNGVGYESWENVWGIWNGIAPRDAEAVRRVATLLRFFGGKGQEHLHSSKWTPHAPLAPGATARMLYASKWESDVSPDRGTLWHVVNRADRNFSGPLIPIPTTTTTTSTSTTGSVRYFDAYNGRELPAPRAGARGGKSMASPPALEIEMEALGFGAVLALPLAAGAPVPAPLAALLAKMAQMSKQPLESFDETWRPLAQAAVPPPRAVLTAGTPAARGMVAVPRTAGYRFQVRSVAVEPIGPYPREIDSAIDVQYGWEETAGRYHDQLLNVSAFLMDEFPVTVAQFRDFVNGENGRGWAPSDEANFLRGWSKAGGGENGEPAAWAFPESWSPKRPVTHVSLNDARAYCKALGKRLPREHEWQLAAQGTDGRLYPWGNDPNPGCFTPDDSRVYAGPQPVDAQPPKCASPYGLKAMAGALWQYTDEFRDAHTRAVVLRGSSNYRPRSSMWFFPMALENNKHGKYFLMDDSYERAGTVGFRCAADVDAGDDQEEGGEGGAAVALGAPYCPSAMTTDVDWPSKGSPSCVRGYVDTPPQTNPTAVKPQFVNFSATAAEGAAEAYFGGADDWVFFGAPSSRKAGRAGLVSNFTTIGGAPATVYSGNPTEYSWRGGAPVAGATKVDSSVQVMGVGNGFSLSVPASSEHVSVLRLFLGVMNARAHLSASIASANGTFEGTLDSTFFDDFVDAYWMRNEQYVLQFRAGAPGSTLHVNFTMAAQSNGDNAAQSQPGKVLLSAASLTVAK